MGVNGERELPTPPTNACAWEVSNGAKVFAAGGFSKT
jgi:hypothetical protein